MRFALFWFLMCAMPGVAQTVVADRTIRANTVIDAGDLRLHTGKTSADGFKRLEDVVGQEARVALYPGRPIRTGDIGPPAIVTRNQVVRVQFDHHGLSIVTEGRALERGAIGDHIRFMNLSSRATLFGTVQADGSLRVHP
ncbi:MAG: flagellar basal body P-ring formation chaperone FlgA [Pseudomonadota bacterium]